MYVHPDKNRVENASTANIQLLQQHCLVNRKRLYTRLFRCLNFCRNTQPTRKAMPTSTDHVIFEYDHQRVLVLYTREASSSPYESTYTMTAFLEYLDVQWLKMIEDWEPKEGTR